MPNVDIGSRWIEEKIEERLCPVFKKVLSMQYLVVAKAAESNPRWVSIPVAASSRISLL
jgi:hypothetical protein